MSLSLLLVQLLLLLLLLLLLTTLLAVIVFVHWMKKSVRTYHHFAQFHHGDDTQDTNSNELQGKKGNERISSMDIMQILRLLISINWISSTKEMNPITRKSMSKLVTQPSCRVYPCLTAIYLSLIFGFFKCLPFRVYLANSSETWLCY